MINHLFLWLKRLSWVVRNSIVTSILSPSPEKGTVSWRRHWLLKIPSLAIENKESQGSRCNHTYRTDVRNIDVPLYVPFGLGFYTFAKENCSDYMLMERQKVGSIYNLPRSIRLSLYFKDFIFSSVIIIHKYNILWKVSQTTIVKFRIRFLYNLFYLRFT